MDVRIKATLGKWVAQTISVLDVDVVKLGISRMIANSPCCIIICGAAQQARTMRNSDSVAMIVGGVRCIAVDSQFGTARSNIYLLRIGPWLNE